MPKPTGAAKATALLSTTRRGLLKATGALGAVAALAVPVAVLPKAEAAEAGPACALSPTFAALHREREALRHVAEDAAAAAIAGASDEDACEQAALAALAALWESDDRMMATPAERPADLSIKGAFLAEQLEDFEDIERRYAEAITADLCRLFPAGSHTGGR